MYKTMTPPKRYFSTDLDTSMLYYPFPQIFTNAVHVKWHVNRNLSRLNCGFCLEQKDAKKALDP